MVCRIFCKNANTLDLAGLQSNLPLYLRIFTPKKSNPSSIGVMRVLVGDKTRPRSAKKDSTTGRTVSVRISDVAPVISQVTARARFHKHTGSHLSQKVGSH